MKLSWHIGMRRTDASGGAPTGRIVAGTSANGGAVTATALHAKRCNAACAWHLGDGISNFCKAHHLPVFRIMSHGWPQQLHHPCGTLPTTIPLAASADTALLVLHDGQAAKGFRAAVGREVQKTQVVAGMRKRQNCKFPTSDPFLSASPASFAAACPCQRPCFKKRH